jgi:Helix-turn-helix domain
MSHKATTWAWSQKSVSSSAKLVLLALADRHNADNGDCFPSRSRLETDCCMPRTSLKRALDELETAGLITAHERRDKLGRNKSNQYELHLDNNSPEVNDRLFEGTTLDQRGVHSGPGEGAILDPEPVIDNHRLTTLIKVDEAANSSVVVNDGEQFWNEAVGMLLTFGIVESTARTFTGRCLKWAKGDQKRVIEAYEAALGKQPRDPIAYISKIINSKQGGLEQKRKDYEAAFAAIDINSENFSKAWMYDSEADKPTRVSAEDSGLLQSDPFAEPEPVYASPVGGSDGVRAESPTGSKRPKNGYLGKMQIPSLNSGSR